MEKDVKPKKKVHMIAIKSSDPDEKPMIIRLKNTSFYTILVAVCVVVGVILGILIFETRQVVVITSRMITQRQEMNEEYDALSAQYEELQSQYAGQVLEIEELQNQVDALTETLQDKLAVEEEAEEAAIPSGFPVTGTSTPAEKPEDESELDQAVYYEGSEGAVVVATGSGTVELVRQNAYGYYEIHFDHGNGYDSIYTNMGTPLIQQGDSVVRGTPLFLIEEDNTLIKYQITKDDALINVYTIMTVDG